MLREGFLKVILVILMIACAGSECYAAYQSSNRADHSESKHAHLLKPSAKPETPATSEAGPGVKTDYGVYAELPRPSLPPAGGTFVDPVFGTTLMRVTDQNDGAFNATQYSYYPSLNKNNTRLFITAGGNPTLYSFDPVAFKISKKRRLFLSEPQGGHSPGAEDAIWSGVDPDVIYGHDASKLWSYNVAADTYTLIKDFSLELPQCDLWQMSRSLDDNVFAFTLKRGGKPIGYIAWRRNTNSLCKADSQNLDEVQVDKSGQFLVVKQSHEQASGIEVRVVNLITGTAEDLTDSAPDYAPGHSDNGAGLIIGGDNWHNRFTYRRLSSPHQFYTVMEFGQDWSVGSHVSMLADGDEWMLVSTFVANDLASGRVFRNEIFLVAADGSRRVRRLAHTHSEYREYWDSPRGNISRDGRYAVFTSNWGAVDRRDVFICKIPPAGTETTAVKPGVIAPVNVTPAITPPVTESGERKNDERKNGERQNVVWVDAMRSAATSNSLQKITGRDDAPDAGARSQQSIASGDAWIEFTATETNKTRYCGLARSGAGTDFASIDFAIKLTASGVAEVRENGAYAGETTYQSGDVFRIAIEGGKVSYYKNGSMFYTSLNVPAYPLMIKASLVSLKARISNVIISMTPALKLSK